MSKNYLHILLKLCIKQIILCCILLFSCSVVDDPQDIHNNKTRNAADIASTTANVDAGKQSKSQSIIENITPSESAGAQTLLEDKSQDNQQQPIAILDSSTHSLLVTDDNIAAAPSMPVNNRKKLDLKNKSIDTDTHTLLEDKSQDNQQQPIAILDSSAHSPVVTDNNIAAAPSAPDTSIISHTSRGRWHIDYASGWKNFDPSRKLLDNSAFSIGVGYQFSDRIGIEARYLYSNTETISGNRMKVEKYFFNARHHFSRIGTYWQPFFTFGICLLENQCSGGEDYEYQNNLGIGIKYDITTSTYFFGEYTAIYGYNKHTLDNLINFGIGYMSGMQPAHIHDARKRAAEPEYSTQIKLPDKITFHFDINSYKVKPLHNQRLKELAQYLSQYPYFIVVINGHSSSDGPAAYNKKLSQLRAQAIKDILVRQYSMRSKRIFIIGYAATRPITSNHTDKEKSANRRASVRLINIKNKIEI